MKLLKWLVVLALFVGAEIHVGTLPGLLLAVVAAWVASPASKNFWGAVWRSE